MSGIQPCPLCEGATVIGSPVTPANTAFPADSACPHRAGRLDVRAELDDWLEDSRFFGNKVCLVCRRFFESSYQFCIHDGTVLRDAGLKQRPAPLVDKRLQLTCYLGSGSLTDVYGATDLASNTGVAVKVLRRSFSQDSQVAAAFLEEGRRAQGLCHRSIRGVLHCGVLPNGRPYMLTEYLPEHRSLKKAIIERDQQTDYTQLLPIMIAVINTLEYAHQRGFLHLGLSPSNIVLWGRQSSNQAEQSVKLCDFGLAERLFRHLPIDQHAARTTGVFGSPLIISPEYSRAEKITYKSDIYGLAATLYEVIARRPLFMRNSTLDVVLAHLEDAPEPFEQSKEVPPELLDCIFAALSKNPADRPELKHIRECMQDCLNRF